MTAVYSADQANPIEAYATDADLVRRALDFLVDAHGHGKRGADQLHEHALYVETWDPDRWDAKTVALAIAIEAERGCRRCREAIRHWHCCPTGRALLDEAVDAGDRYLEVTGYNFDTPASAQWRDWQRARERFREHMGLSR